MLMREDISKERGLIGRLLVGGATIAVLATTATLVPAGVAQASSIEVVDPNDIPAPPAPPAPPAAPDAPEPPEAPDAPDAHRVMVFTSTNVQSSESETTSEDGKKREVTRVVIHRDGEGDAKAPKARRMEFRMPGSLSRDDILSTLKEQGITGAQADAIADKLEAKRKEGFRSAMAPIPPIPPIPAIPPIPSGAWSSAHGKSFTVSHCGGGKKAVPLVDRRDDQDGKRSHVVMMRCADSAENKAARLSALKKARDNFEKAPSSQHMSAEIRAKVAADLDRAIAELEKPGE